MHPDPPDLHLLFASREVSAGAGARVGDGRDLSLEESIALDICLAMEGDCNGVQSRIWECDDRRVLSIVRDVLRDRIASPGVRGENMQREDLDGFFVRVVESRLRVLNAQAEAGAAIERMIRAASVSRLDE